MTDTNHETIAGFSSRVRSLRERAGYTQAGLAWVLGIHVDSVRNYETGRTTPRLENLQPLADALECSVIDLIWDGK